MFILLSLLIALMTLLFWTLCVVWIVLKIAGLYLFELMGVSTMPLLMSMSQQDAWSGTSMLVATTAWTYGFRAQIGTAWETFCEWAAAAWEYGKTWIVSWTARKGSAAWRSLLDAGAKEATLAEQAIAVKAVEVAFSDPGNPVVHVDLVIRKQTGKPIPYHYGKDAENSTEPSKTPAAAESAPAKPAAPTQNPSNAAPVAPAAASTTEGAKA